MRRFFRLVIKLGILAAIGFGIAVAIKKFTATPESFEAPLEPWPPLDTDAVANAANGVASAASTAADKVGDAASTAADKASKAASTAADKASKAASTAADKVGDAASAVKDAAEES